MHRAVCSFSSASDADALGPSPEAEVIPALAERTAAGGLVRTILVVGERGRGGAEGSALVQPQHTSAPFTTIAHRLSASPVT